MSFSHLFLVPDYYPSFRCKGGDCRSTCCVGWGISVTMNEYFRLLGMTCPPDLRKRLDCAFHAPEDPSPDRFRLITPRWDGDCPLRAPDGLCALQSACGEDVLPAVCRYYPRSPRCEFAYECSCSNSCEKVLEMLMDRVEPLTFRSVPLTFDFDLPADKKLRHPRGYYNAIRKMCGDILQRRGLSLPERIVRIGAALRAVGPLLDGDPGRMMETLVRLSLCADAVSLPSPDPASALRALQQLSAAFTENSVSLSRYAGAASACIRSAQDEPAQALADYAQANAHFCALFPQWPRHFEQMLVNHLFYECFPFSDAQESLEDEFLALCAVYALVRYWVVGYMADKTSRDDYVDAAAGAFRLIEHSRFDHNAAVLLRRAGCTQPDALANLVLL